MGAGLGVGAGLFRAGPLVRRSFTIAGGASGCGSLGGLFNSKRELFDLEVGADPSFRGCPSPGMFRALLGRQLFRARGPSALREPFPRSARVSVRHVWPPGDRPMRVGPGPPLPPGPLHLHLLPAPAHQGLLPGARGQALLPALLPQALRLTTCRGRPSGRAQPQRPRPPPPKRSGSPDLKALLLELGAPPARLLEVPPHWRNRPRRYCTFFVGEFRKGPTNPYGHTPPEVGPYTDRSHVSPSLCSQP